jgi:transketolase
MINSSLKLLPDLLKNAAATPAMGATRDGFGRAIMELGDKNPNVVVLCADLAESTRVLEFKNHFPNRYVELGVAEQNLATVASGMASFGKIPFITSYATFSPGRNNEQIRTTVSINNVPVKIAGMHAGISVGPDGATHQALEDIALMQVQPNMTVISPCDSEEARKATLAAAEHNGPVYLRFAREKTPVMTTTETPFIFGKANLMWTSDKPAVTVIATGPLIYNALKAAQELEKEIQVEVINIHTIKPLDREAILASVKKSGAVVTVEEHQIAGGLGSLVAQLLAQELPVPMEFAGVEDKFGQSGKPDELIEYYKMGVSSIVEKIGRVSKRK